MLILFGFETKQRLLFMVIFIVFRFLLLRQKRWPERYLEAVGILKLIFTSSSRLRHYGGERVVYGHISISILEKLNFESKACDRAIVCVGLGLPLLSLTASSLLQASAAATLRLSQVRASSSFPSHAWV